MLCRSARRAVAGVGDRRSNLELRTTIRALSIADAQTRRDDRSAWRTLRTRGPGIALESRRALRPLGPRISLVALGASCALGSYCSLGGQDAPSGCRRRTPGVRLQRDVRGAAERHRVAQVVCGSGVPVPAPGHAAQALSTRGSSRARRPLWTRRTRRARISLGPLRSGGSRRPLGTRRTWIALLALHTLRAGDARRPLRAGDARRPLRAGISGAGAQDQEQ